MHLYKQISANGGVQDKDWELGISSESGAAKDDGKPNTLLLASAVAGTHIDVSRLNHGFVAGRHQGRIPIIASPQQKPLLQIPSPGPLHATPMQCSQRWHTKIHHQIPFKRLTFTTS
jgi:hypothetical protein